MVPSSDTPRGHPEAGAPRRILVVEDELLIRLLVSDELRAAGFEVIEAADADEAVTLLRSLVPIDLIISDVRMPGSIDGLGLLAVVRESFPTLPVIITSGHLESRLAIADGAARFLAKPYGMNAVVDAVRLELAKTQ
jgi:DNA-binding NtrC family response regulator